MKHMLGTTLSLALATTIGMAADSPRLALRSAIDDAATRASLPRLATSVPPASSAKPVPKPPPPRMKLDVVSPRYDASLPYGVMSSSGWPLVLRVTGPDSALGIAVNAAPMVFPGIAQSGYLVLADPDNCLELPLPFFRGSDSPCATSPTDETYVEFTNDIELAGVLDGSGNPDRGLALGDALQSGGPVFRADGDSDSNGVLEPVDVVVGPDTGDAVPIAGSSELGTVADGVGFGADDDFPGLVLLSPTGPGLVLNSDFTRPAVLQQRNLAGFLNAVAYELRGAGNTTTFTLSMVVPHGLVAPIMKIDDCVGTFDTTLGRCDGAARYQLDGDGIMREGDANAMFLYPALINATPYFEVRAFIVNGIAPSVLADMNHDGVVSPEDARLAGYTVISNEQVIRVRQYATDICTGTPLLNVFYADFDGNGHDTSIFVCPAGPGRITRPPV